LIVIAEDSLTSMAKQIFTLKRIQKVMPWIVISTTDDDNKEILFTPVICTDKEVQIAIETIKNSGKKPLFVLAEKSLMEMLSQISQLKCEQYNNI